MEHYRPAPGTPLQDLDTPCLLIDLDAVEHNFRLIADAVRRLERSAVGRHISLGIRMRK